MSHEFRRDPSADAVRVESKTAPATVQRESARAPLTERQQARAKQEGKFARESLLHICSDAQRLLNTFRHADSVDKSKKTKEVFAAPEEMLTEEMFEEQMMRPLQTVAKYLELTEDEQKNVAIGSLFPKTLMSRDVMITFLEHHDDPNWFSSKEREEIAAEIGAVVMRSKV